MRGLIVCLHVCVCVCCDVCIYAFVQFASSVNYKDEYIIHTDTDYLVYRLGIVIAE